MVEFGLTKVLPPEIVNVLAPVGAMVNTPPLQIEPLFAAIVGEVNTVILAIAGFIETHPKLSEPIILYELLTDGFTVLLPLL